MHYYYIAIPQHQGQSSPQKHHPPQHAMHLLLGDVKSCHHIRTHWKNISDFPCQVFSFGINVIRGSTVFYIKYLEVYETKEP